MVAHAEQSAKNKAEGAAYLAENSKKEGVITTESGLQYKSLIAGDGSKPGKSDRVKVHYRGTLIDGTVFDSSYDRGEPIVFPVTGVIAGWIEGLQLMQVGSKFELTIPSNLAYGANGSGPTRMWTRWPRTRVLRVTTPPGWLPSTVQRPAAPMWR